MDPRVPSTPDAPSAPVSVVSQALEALISKPTASLPTQPSRGGGDGERDILGTLVIDRRLRILSADLSASCFRGLTATPGTTVTSLFPVEDAPTIALRLERVLDTGKPLVARVQRLPTPSSSLVVSLTALPLASGRLAVTLIDMTQKLHLFAASSTIGTTLDVAATARELAEALMPWGDVSTVSLAYHVWTGEQPEEGREVRLRRAALAPADRAWPAGFLTPGDNLPAVSALLPGPDGSRDAHSAFILPDRADIERALGNDPGLLRALVPDDGPLALACTPLIAQGASGRDPVLLGTVEVWRRMDGRWAPFDDNDMLALHELASRAGVYVDNARQHQREHAQVIALQHRLLPPHSPTTTVETAGAYRPTTPDSAGVGGDWFDIIRLPGNRIALVIGDVVGHGLGAAATMGRLRTVVQTLALADLAPDEILTHLDDQVEHLDETDVPDEEGQGYSAVGSTCCYLVYDPVDRRCTMASAGHLPPALVLPDGRTEIVELSPHPPLGTAKEPFEITEFTVEPGTLLALYTDGLVESPVTSIDDGMRIMLDELSHICPADNLRSAIDRAVSHLAGAPLRDDVTLLLARLSALPDDDVATWHLPATDSRAVSHARDLTTTRMEAWGLADRSYATELVVSELVTNAVRYSEGDVTLRLIRADANRLVCEVTDPSSAAPRLRHARQLDERGRGLFIVQQLTDRWGVRQAPTTGKTTWAELTKASTRGF